MIDYHRWNFGTNGNGLVVCKNEHDKGQPCEYNTVSPHEIVIIIDDLRAQLFEAQKVNNEHS